MSDSNDHSMSDGAEEQKDVNLEGDNGADTSNGDDTAMEGIDESSSTTAPEEDEKTSHESESKEDAGEGENGEEKKQDNEADDPLFNEAFLNNLRNKALTMDFKKASNRDLFNMIFDGVKDDVSDSEMEDTDAGAESQGETKTNASAHKNKSAPASQQHSSEKKARTSQVSPPSAPPAGKKSTPQQQKSSTTPPTTSQPPQQKVSQQQKQPPTQSKAPTQAPKTPTAAAAGSNNTAAQKKSTTPAAPAPRDNKESKASTPTPTTSELAGSKKYLAELTKIAETNVDMRESLVPLIERLTDELAASEAKLAEAETKASMYDREMDTISKKFLANNMRIYQHVSGYDDDMKAKTNNLIQELTGDSKSLGKMPMAEVARQLDEVISVCSKFIDGQRAVSEYKSNQTIEQLYSGEDEEGEDAAAAAAADVPTRANVASAASKQPQAPQQRSRALDKRIESLYNRISGTGAARGSVPKRGRDDADDKPIVSVNSKRRKTDGPAAPPAAAAGGGGGGNTAASAAKKKAGGEGTRAKEPPSDARTKPGLSLAERIRLARTDDLD